MLRTTVQLWLIVGLVSLPLVAVSQEIPANQTADEGATTDESMESDLEADDETVDDEGADDEASMAQEDEGSDDEGADDEMSDDEPDGADDESAEDGVDEDDLNLDFEALGGMNPEKELSSNHPVSAQEATQVAVAEDWTKRNLELLEVHGYFRVRPSLYHKFYIRNDPSLYPLNADREAGCTKFDKCATNAGADMRFLLDPTVNLSEEVRINAELIFLDNVMMGSTPTYPVAGGAQTVANGAMLGYNQGDVPRDYFIMNRAWGEMESALGLLRFGRMPTHWGTGMLYNSGDGLDDDLGDSVDRISFTFKLNGWMVMPAFDFPNEGLSLDSAAGRPFDVSQLDDAYRIVGVVAYQHEKEDQLAILRRGDWLVNTGLHFSYRAQAMQFQWTAEDDGAYDPATENQISTYKRDLWAITPDLWFQFLADTFHLELELAFNIGHLSEPAVAGTEMDALDILGFGGVLQIDYGLLSDQLRLGVEFGIASGDKDVKGLGAPASFDQPNGDSNRYGLFSFNGAFKPDRILYRHILGSVAGSYYFKPWLRYDFLNSAMGKKLGVQLDILFSRAIYAQSTISDSAKNLGVEVDAKVDFATADNFHASLAYGVLFPLNGFKGDYSWTDTNGDNSFEDTDLSIPQTLQLLLGITF